MTRLKAVIFDLDGTIADTIPLCLAAFRRSVEPLIGRSLSDEGIFATFGPSEEGTIMALAPDAYDRGMADYLSAYQELHEAMCPAPFAGIVEVIDMLRRRGVRVAMVTGKGPFSTEISLRRFGMEDSFEIVETGVMSGPIKPLGIRNVLNRFSDTGRDKVVYVGDSYHDIVASRETGVPVASVAWASSADPDALRKHSPDALLYTVAEFREWLNDRI